MPASGSRVQGDLDGTVGPDRIGASAMNIGLIGDKEPDFGPILWRVRLLLAYLDAVRKALSRLSGYVGYCFHREGGVWFKSAGPKGPPFPPVNRRRIAPLAMRSTLCRLTCRPSSFSVPSPLRLVASSSERSASATSTGRRHRRRRERVPGRVLPSGFAAAACRRSDGAPEVMLAPDEPAACRRPRPGGVVGLRRPGRFGGNAAGLSRLAVRA